MLTPVYTRRFIIMSSLFAAVCAGYVAGRRVPLSTSQDAVRLQHEWMDPAQISPHSAGKDITVSPNPEAGTLQPRDTSVDALLAMTNTNTWEVLVRPAPTVKRVHWRLEMREAGKKAETLVDQVTYLNRSEEQSGETERFVVSSMPLDASLSRAKSLRFRMASGGSSTMQDVPNPFQGYSSFGSVSYPDELPTKSKSSGIGVAEIALAEANFIQEGKRVRNKILYMTFQAEYKE